MPAFGNPYLDQFSRSMAEAAQVANQLREAHLQKQEINNQAQQAQQRQQLEEAEFEQRKGQAGLANALALNDRGASPVSASGTVPSTLPDMLGAPQAMPIPDPLNGLPGHGFMQSEVPAGYGGHMVVNTPDGKAYQIPTASEQFNRGLAQQLQQAEAMFPLDTRRRQSA